MSFALLFFLAHIFRDTVFLSKHTTVICGVSALIHSELKNGSEAGGKSTQAVTLCHLSFQSKSLCCSNHVLPCCLKQETDSCLESTLKPRKYMFHSWTAQWFPRVPEGKKFKNCKTTQIIDVTLHHFWIIWVCCSKGISFPSSALYFPILHNSCTTIENVFLTARQ